MHVTSCEVMRKHDNSTADLEDDEFRQITWLNTAPFKTPRPLHFQRLLFEGGVSNYTAAIMSDIQKRSLHQETVST